MKASNNLFKKQYENIQLIEGNSNNNGGHQTITVTVKVSRQRKEQTVHT